MDVDNPEMSTTHALTILSDSGQTMKVDDSAPSIVSGHPNLVLDMPETQVDVPPPSLTQCGRPSQEYRLPKRFRDNLLESPAHVPTMPSNSDSNTNIVRQVILIVCDRLVTAKNLFAIWRDYPERPSADPDSHITLEELSNLYHGHLQSQALFESKTQHPSHWPFLNGTVHGVMQWLNNRQMAKSEAETTKLIHNVILSPNFNPDDLVGFDAHCENQQLNKAVSESALRTQFTESSVNILIPSGASHIEGKTFEVPALLHRDLTSVIREAFESPLTQLYHYFPFELFQKSHRSGKEDRIYGEIFTSDAFLEETERVQRHGLVPTEDPKCKEKKLLLL